LSGCGGAGDDAVMTTVDTQRAGTEANPQAGGVGLGFFPPDARSAVELIERAERAGVATAWIVMPPAGYDSPTLAAAALAGTTRIRVGTSIVPAFTRHPVVLATQVAALAELAPGRFRLGIGTGGLATVANGFGTPVAHPLGTMREYIDVLRAALDTGVVDHRGSAYQVGLQMVAPPVTRSGPMPVTLAALGPRMFELAGERADAAMSWMCPPAYLDAVARPAVAKGAAAAQRPTPPIITHVSAVVATDPVAARAAARPSLQTYARNAQYAAMFASAGVPIAHDSTPSDALIDAVTVHGDETGLTDRLGGLAEEQDELLVTLESAGDRRAHQDTLLRALGNITRTLATDHRHGTR
jgi:alkanesulfonate monooxygenase SsuD/methylene tetrahydromethanopterin reductase-like flavin-dependent oxidoreductase (luciferase family)